MKTLKVLSIIAIIASFVACKKGMDSPDPEYIEGFTRVIGVNVKDKDTSSTPFMQGRTETVGLAFAEDDKLSAELIAYYQGIYTIKVTSKVDCQGIIRWSWEDLKIFDIDPVSDVIQGGSIVTFTMQGEAKPGKIKLQLHSDCGNSSTLIINITSQILPIKYTSHTTKRVGEDMIVNFSTEEPEKVDWFYVLWSPDGNTAHEVVKNSFECDKVTKQYTLSFAAVHKTK